MIQKKIDYQQKELEKELKKTHKIDKNKQEKKRNSRGDSVKVIKVKAKNAKSHNGKRVISRLTVQQRKKSGESYQKIAQHFGVDKELIRKIDLGFYGPGYMQE